MYYLKKSSVENSKKSTNVIYLESGFAYDENEFCDLKYVLTIGIEKNETIKGNVILGYDYYEKIKNASFKDIDVEIYHHNKGNKSEYFFVEIPFSQIDKLEEYTDAFLEQIVTPFFKKLNTLK